MGDHLEEPAGDDHHGNGGLVVGLLGAQHSHAHAADGEGGEQGPEAAAHAKELAGQVGQHAPQGAGDEVEAAEDGCDVARPGDGVAEHGGVVGRQGVVQGQLRVVTQGSGFRDWDVGSGAGQAVQTGLCSSRGSHVLSERMLTCNCCCPVSCCMAGVCSSRGLRMLSEHAENQASCCCPVSCSQAACRKHSCVLLSHDSQQAAAHWRVSKGRFL